MKSISILRLIGMMAGLASLAACATAAPFKPARLADPGEASVAKIRQTLREALNKPQLQIGPTNGANTTNISVLPPNASPLETRNLAIPTIYNIMSNGRSCQLVEANTGVVIQLSGVVCVVVE